MKSFVKTLLFLILTIVSFSECKYDTTEVPTILDEDTQCSNDSTCPTWFTCSAEKRCQCDNMHMEEILCDDKTRTSAILKCNCVTYDKVKGPTYVGACFYNSQSPNFINKLVKNPKALINYSVCTHFHRTGLLCGNCEAGHSPLVLSYNLSCVECPDGHKNWWRFILAGFVPLTYSISSY